MGGLGFLLVIFVYIFVTFALVILTPTLKFKALVLLSALLIPSADAIYGRIKLNQMCKADGGLRIYKQPHDIEGYMSEFIPDETAVKNRFFTFSEAEVSKGVFNRSSMQNGTLIHEKNVKPRSRYKAYLGNVVQLNSSYGYQDSVVETYPEGEVVARDRLYLFWSGWAERFLDGFADAGPSWVKCNKARLLPRELLLTLKSGDK